MLYLANGAPGSLSYGAGSYIDGFFERAITSTASDYYFPVGVSQRQMALFNFTNLTSGSLRTSYIEADPNGSGLPLFDLDGQQVAFEYNDGYWTALAQNGLISTDYDLSLDATGFSDPDPLNSDARIIKRTGTGDWTIDGSNGTFAGTVLERLGCSGIDNSSGSHFGIGTGNCFTISSDPSSLIRCVGSSASIQCFNYRRIWDCKLPVVERW